MNFTLLYESANSVIEQILLLIKDEGTNETLESIKQQMIFIRDNSKVGINPISALTENKKFTYGILASREFASPRELELKENINRVSRIMDNEKSIE